jgi:putative Mg2+ transporter-C (MgtC) family protein
MDLGIGAICMRLACAMAVGMIIGTEREYTNRPAGLRTHILVALGACVVTVTGQLIFFQYQALGASPDPARLSAQVITGVGFLGAGTILREGSHVKGLTTAASLWAVACLGIAAGFGLYSAAIAGMIFIFITLTILEFFQHKLMGSHTPVKYYALESADISAALDTIHTLAQKHAASISHMQARQGADGVFHIAFQAEIGGIRGKKRQQQFLTKLAADPAIVHLEAADSISKLDPASQLPG